MINRSIVAYAFIIAGLLLQFGFTSATASQLIGDDKDIKLLASAHKGDLASIKKRKVLRALVTYSRTDFFTVQGEPKGLVYDYMTHYEKFLNKGIKREENKTKVLFLPVPFNQLIPALLEGRGDVAAAILTVTPKRKQFMEFGTSGRNDVSELLVTHKSVGGIKKLEDLSGKEIYVLRSSSYAEHLRDLNKKFKLKKLKPIIIREADQYLLTEDILELVNAGVVKITVSDNYKAVHWAKVLKNIVVHKNIPIAKKNAVGVGIRKNNPELKKSFERFLKSAKKGTLFGNMTFDRYYKNVKWIKNPNSEAERKKFNKFIGLFEKYGNKYQFDELAIAAQAYQESGLDNSRKSHVGAVGIMQLLPSTAADPNVGIPNIRPLENNIHAGVKYMNFLRERYFSGKELLPVDRFAFSWAAYNAGPGRVRQMRALAKKMGLNPNKWFHNVEVAAGKIVGRETVKYVSNIYKYYIAYTLSEELEEKRETALQGKTKKNVK
ncbi:transglycosylase SLT domain-containing protein [Pseudomonadota bacterium]